MSAVQDRYESAAKKFENLNEMNTKASLDINKEAARKSLEANKRATQAAIKDQQKFLDNLKNRDLYQEAYEKASKGAAGQAAAQGAQAQAQARGAGMSKAAAAEMGANATNQAFNNALAQQQGMASNAIGQKLGMQQSGLNQKTGTMMQGANQAANLNMNAAGNAMGALNNQVANQGTLMGSQQQEASNVYNRAYGNLGMGTSAIGGLLQAFSDENTKDLKKNNTDVDAILKKYQPKKNLKDLVIKHEEKK